MPWPWPTSLSDIVICQAGGGPQGFSEYRSRDLSPSTGRAESIEPRVSLMDHGYDLDNEMRSVAEAILRQPGRDFAKLEGENRQLDLY